MLTLSISTPTSCSLASKPIITPSTTSSVRSMTVPSGDSPPRLRTFDMLCASGKMFDGEDETGAHPRVQA